MLPYIPSIHTRSRLTLAEIKMRPFFQIHPQLIHAE